MTSTFTANIVMAVVDARILSGTSSKIVEIMAPYGSVKRVTLAIMPTGTKLNQIRENLNSTTKGRVNTITPKINEARLSPLRLASQSAATPPRIEAGSAVSRYTCPWRPEAS